MKYLKKIVVVLMLYVGLVVSAHAANTELCEEIALDPLGRGYAGMSPEQAHADIQTKYRTRWLPCVEGNLLRDQITESDWVSIATDAQRDRLINVLVGCANPQGFARSRVVEILGAGQSLSNMAAIATEDISRVTELELGRVRVGDIVACGSGD